ncbi:hypothetical protein [Methylomonas sp. UP202]|uniref:hypothetical protein n=1 Tax=Methylomonas sp. UP202 TaxID=3040943 RepID=UPI00247B1A8D|nr:hypothetical protein [Methylomonas sp. UP202]WGS83868.1 hypothetical protein QC632_12450 [Methylomonas sp. UP202]
MFVNTTSNTHPTYGTSSVASNYQANSNVFKSDNTNTRLANADSVSISDNAYRALNEASQPSKDAADPVSVAAKKLIDNVNNDPEFADEMAQAYAYSIDLKPIPMVNGHLPTVNDTEAWAQMTQGQAEFETQASSIRDQRIQLYTNMKANGASGADIFKSIMEFNKNLPSDYQKATRIDQFTKYF